MGATARTCDHIVISWCSIFWVQLEGKKRKSATLCSVCNHPHMLITCIISEYIHIHITLLSEHCNTSSLITSRVSTMSHPTSRPQLCPDWSHLTSDSLSRLKACFEGYFDKEGNCQSNGEAGAPFEVVIKKYNLIHFYACPVSTVTSLKMAKATAKRMSLSWGKTDGS